MVKIGSVAKGVKDVAEALNLRLQRQLQPLCAMLDEHQRKASQARLTKLMQLSVMNELPTLQLATFFAMGYGESSRFDSICRFEVDTVTGNGSIVADKSFV